MHTHIYSIREKSYCNVFELESIFYHSVDITNVSYSFQRAYGWKQIYGSYVTIGRATFIEINSFIKFFPILFYYYFEIYGRDRISEKLLCFYSCLKYRRDYMVE